MNDIPELISETGVIPKERFKDAQEVWFLCNQMLEADRPRSSQRALIQRQIDGNRPMNPQQLKDNQMGWRANVNYREAEGGQQAIRTPYFDMVTEPDCCIDLAVTYGKGEKPIEWSRIIAEEGHRAIQKRWDGFDFHVMLRQSTTITYGWGAHINVDPYDPRPVTKTQSAILFPEGSTIELDKLPFFCLVERMSANELAEKVAHREAARSIGWNLDVVWKTIANSRINRDSVQKTPEEIQGEVKNGDVGWAYIQAEPINLFHMFVKEFDTAEHPGRISHYIVNQQQNVPGYLFRHLNRFESWDQLISFFPFDIGSDGTIHSIRGFGARTFAFFELSNRLKNNMVDQALLNSGILLTQTAGAVDPQNMQLQRIGLMSILPPGLAPASFNPVNLQQGGIALDQLLRRTNDENNKTYRQTNDSGDNQARTAYEVAANAADSQRLQNSQNNLEIRGLTRWYREFMRRLCNQNIPKSHPAYRMVMDFQNRCFARGVPPEALMFVTDVTARAAMGSGSAMQRIAIAREILNVLYPSAGPVQRNNMLKDFAAALAGQQNVQRYVVDVNDRLVPTDDDSIAALENDALMRGGETVVTPTQNHDRHCARHLGKAAELMQAIQQGQADPAMVLQGWNNIGPHVALHLQYLAQDPTQKVAFKQYEQQLVQLSQYADQLKQNLEEMAQAAEEEAALAGPQEQPMDEQQMKLLELQQDYELKKAKIDAEIQLKREKQQQEMMLNDAKTAAEIRGNRPYKR